MRQVRIHLAGSRVTPDLMRRLADVLERYSGDRPVSVLLTITVRFTLQ